MRTLFLLLIAIFLIGAGCQESQTSEIQQTGDEPPLERVPVIIDVPDTTETPPIPPGMVSGQADERVVEISSSGFAPRTLNVQAGETVKFLNKDSEAHWPASALHPTHDVYPEKGGCISSAFDACKGLVTGETYSFTFNSVGTWKYHDHINPKLTGTIVVE